MELHRNPLTVNRLMYHFVLILKFRYRVFVEPYREAMKAIIHKIGYDYDFDIQDLEIPEDHIHMVIKGELIVAPSQVMQMVKSISAREFLDYIQG